MNRYKYRIVQEGAFFITQERVLHFFWCEAYGSDRTLEDAKRTVKLFSEIDAGKKTTRAKRRQAKRTRRVVWP